jgi:hypothetical protein
LIFNIDLLGKENFYKLQKILVSSNIYIEEVHENFSQYKLPIEFDENKNRFCKNNKIPIKDITYSSSSKLFILRTKKPNIDMIKKHYNSKIYP